MRLTKWIDGLIHMQNDEQEFDLWEIDVIKKLAAYEGAEERGLLVRLPCKVGDVVYRIHTKDHVEKHRVIAFHVYASGLWFWDENGRETPVETIGKTVFLTREEAEAALKGETQDV